MINSENIWSINDLDNFKLDEKVKYALQSGPILIQYGIYESKIFSFSTISGI